MIRLECDYAEGAHERVLRRLFETNLEQTPGYGEDLDCARAREYIQQLGQREGIDVHFLVGGTQTNTTVIAAALRPHQGVIAATSGHINVHETGAIEATGHKVLAVPSADGKLTGREVRRVYESHWQDATREHMVQPGMVYLSQPTENGTLYSLAELTDLWETCQDCGLFLFVDGARLGYGLMSEACDMTLPDLARRCDGFSGTTSSSTAACWPRVGCWGCSSVPFWRTDFTLNWPAMPTGWPWSCAGPLRPGAMRCSLTPTPISSIPFCPMGFWPNWRRNLPLRFGARWTVATRRCGSAPAGPRNPRRSRR